MAINIDIAGIPKLQFAASALRKASQAIRERLLRAANDFGNDVVKTSREDYLTGPRPKKLGVGTGNLRSRIRSIVEASGNDINIKVGTDVIYGRIHEKGGTTHPTVTKKMRGWAWYMYGKTGEDKFKGLALTRKNRLTIKLPARPFLSPAVKDNLPKFKLTVQNILRESASLGAA